MQCSFLSLTGGLKLADKAVTIGDLKQRITFQQLTQTSDGQGGQIDTWIDYQTVWAKVEPVKASERLFAKNLEYQRSHKVTCRYLEGITSDISHTFRFTFDNRYFQVKGVRRDLEEKFWLFIDAEENQGS